MPLSEHEQRILDEIERRLAAEDPKFARSTTLTTPRGVAGKRIRRGVGGFVVGIGLLISALVVGLDRTSVVIPLGVIAFAVMLLSINVLVQASREIGASLHARERRESWFSKHEERWRKRFDRGE